MSNQEKDLLEAPDFIKQTQIKIIKSVIINFKPMEINVNKQMGNTSLEVTINEKDEKEALAKAIIFTQPDICGLCKKENIVWNANKVNIKEKDTHTYIKRRCLSCGAVSVLGEFKTGGYFWKKWSKYNRSTNNGPIKEERFLSFALK
jgi:hypothetical protein